MPFQLFEQLLAMAEELGYKRQPVNCAGRKGIPLELKVLGVLRVLGRGTWFDGIEELAEGSAEVPHAEVL